MRAFVLLVACALLGIPAAAQKLDSALTDSLPALLPAVDFTDLLADVPGSFTYQFATPGWPDGWAFHGLPPQQQTLTFNGLPFTHVFTGRAANQLVPLALLEPPRLKTNQFGHPFAVLTRLRPFVSAEPVTEAKYWKGGDGLQSIEAVHAQRRRRPLFGRPGFLNLLGAYAGRAADGEYPGSRLRRARQVLLRAWYEQQDWSLELFNLHNRRSIGAHGGVIPEPGDFESIYNRTAPTVENPQARRRVIRNDLAATMRGRLFADSSTVQFFWTAETFRYTTASDTLGTRSDRLGVAVSQPLVRTDAHLLTIDLNAWAERVSAREHFDRADMSRSIVHATARDTFDIGGWDGAAEAGAAFVGGSVRPVGAVSLTGRFGSMSLSASASLSDRPNDVVAETGFGSLSGSSDAPFGRVLLGRAAARFEGETIDLELGAFAHRSSPPTDYFAVGGDSAAVLTAASSFDRLGAFLDAGWRRDAERGVYVTFQPTLHRFLRADDSPLHERMANTLPTLSLRTRLGARYVVFAGDLDFDAYAEGLAWSALRSRTLHPATGLLTVPEASSMVFGPSTMLNLVVEAGVRDATIFLVYENALSGTVLMAGNLIVPVYPLPARRFRFGVFWPIFG